jgi:hypothetical protein
LVAVGREALGGATRARPAVFDLEEAVAFISEGLPPDVASRLTYDDVRWVLRTDVDVASVLQGRTRYLRAIGAIGPEVLGDPDGDDAS